MQEQDRRESELWPQQVRDQPRPGGQPREERWAVTHIEEKDADSWPKKNIYYSYILIYLEVATGVLNFCLFFGYN